MADLVERLRTHASGHLPLGCTDERMLLEEAAAALEAEASKGERWQPIETVPRDGTKVLLFFPSYKEVPVDLYRFDDLGGPEFPWEASDGWGSDVGSEDGPTHWRPLPAPPQDNREG